MSGPYGGSQVRTDALPLGFHATEASNVGGLVAPAAITLNASASAYSREIDVREKTKLSLYLVITGSGTVKAEVLVSPAANDTTLPFVLHPDGVVVTGQGSTTGAVFRIDVPLSGYVKIKLTEDGGAAAAVVTAYLMAQ